jgi:N-acetyl-anhydromuramyl-L-alanine amidase AmpD
MAVTSRALRGRAGTLLAALLALTAVAAVAAKPAGHPRRRAVDTIVVHSLGGPDCRDGRRFYRTIDGDARTWMATFQALPIVSIHYVIGRDGQVEAGVPEADAATHAVGWNQRSIGIELVNNGDGADPFPEAQVAALVQLVQDIRRRHPAVTADRVWRHSDVDHSTFAASRHGEACTQYRRKEDPGAAFPWTAFLAAIAAVDQRGGTTAAPAAAPPRTAAPRP